MSPAHPGSKHGKRPTHSPASKRPRRPLSPEEPGFHAPRGFQPPPKPSRQEAQRMIDQHEAPNRRTPQAPGPPKLPAGVRLPPQGEAGAKLALARQHAAQRKLLEGAPKRITTGEGARPARSPVPGHPRRPPKGPGPNPPGPWPGGRRPVGTEQPVPGRLPRPPQPGPRPFMPILRRKRRTSTRSAKR